MARGRLRSVRVKATLAALAGAGVALTLIAGLLVYYIVSTASELQQSFLDPQQKVYDEVDLRIRDGRGTAGLVLDEPLTVEVFTVDGELLASGDATDLTAARLREPDWEEARARLLTDDAVMVTTLGEYALGSEPFLVVGAAMITVFALVALATWRVTGRALRPIDAIRAEVEGIAADNLHRRVPRPDSDDEVARLADTMNGMLERLEQATVRQQQFVADASHELRSPIASIRAAAEIALAHPDRVDARRALADVLEEDRRLQQIVDALLQLTRLDESAATAMVEIDLDELLSDELARLSGVEVDEERLLAGRVLGSRQQLTSVVRNVVENAARHARTRMAVALHEKDGLVELVVDDDGPGVPVEDRERVFERFTRLDAARTRDGGGVGLGLAIVRSVVARHYGSVRISESPLGGARVTVTLPAAPGP